MKYYKLTNSGLEPSPYRLIIKDNGRQRIIMNPGHKDLLTAGYKPLVEVGKDKELESGEFYSVKYTEEANRILAEYTVNKFDLM